MSMDRTACATARSGAVLACGDDLECAAAAQDAYDMCLNPPLSAPPGPGSFGAMFSRGDSTVVSFGSDLGGGALVFRPVPKGKNQVAATTRTCADAASAALGAADGPDRVYCFQQTTPSGGRAGVYMAKCTSAAASVAVDGSVVPAVTCPILAADDSTPRIGS